MMIDISVNPADFQVVYSDGTKRPFDPSRIYSIVKKVFINVEGHDAVQSERVEEICETAVKEVVHAVTRSGPGNIHIYNISDYIELYLLRREYPKQARVIRRQL